MKQYLRLNLIVVCCAVFLFSPTTATAVPWLEEFSGNCRQKNSKYNSQYYKIKIFFAPLIDREELPENEREQSWWQGGGIGYQFKNGKTSYDNDIYELMENSEDKVWLAQEIELKKEVAKKPKNIPSGEGKWHKYIWIVISAPPILDSKQPMNAMVREKDAEKAKAKGRIKESSDEGTGTLITISDHWKISRIRDDNLEYQILLHMDQKLSDEDQTDINNFWKALVSNQAFDNLVWESKEERELNDNDLAPNAYNHTFYFWPIPALGNNKYGRHELRNASSRRVVGPGKVYGFALDSDGQCLAATSVDVKKAQRNQ